MALRTNLLQVAEVRTSLQNTDEILGFANDYTTEIRFTFANLKSAILGGSGTGAYLLKDGSEAMTGGLEINPTWNSAPTVFSSLKVDATDTSSDSSSLLIDLQKDSTPVFQVVKSGQVKVNNANALFLASNVLTLGNSSNTSVQTWGDLSLTSVWNNGATTFAGIDQQITDTASNSGSKAYRLRVGGVDKASISKGGDGTFAGIVDVGASGYYQGGVRILYKSSVTGSLAVGEGAGNALNSTGLNNTLVGYQAGYDSANATTNDKLTALGYNSAFSNSGDNVTAAGYLSAYENTGASVTAVGYSSGNSNAGSNLESFGFQSADENTGSNVAAYGTQSAYQNSGNNLIAIGYRSAYQNTGVSVTSVGYLSAYQNTASNLVSVGYSALANRNASSSVAVGYQAGYGSDGVRRNISNSCFIGYRSGYAITTGNNNTFLGYSSGGNVTSGSKNVILGYGIDAPVSTGSNQLAIANAIFGIGHSATGTTISPGRLGLFTNAPASKLDVVDNSQAVNTWTSIADCLTDASFRFKGSSHANGYGLFMGYANSVNNAQGIQAGDQVGAAAVPLLINPFGGNVGIGGATNPQAVVDILSPSSTGASSGETYGIRIQDGANSGSDQPRSLRMGVNTAVTGYGYIQYSYEGTSYGNDYGLKLNPLGGNVTIGNAVAAQQLTVNQEMAIRAPSNAGNIRGGVIGFYPAGSYLKKNAYIASYFDKPSWSSGVGLIFATVSSPDISGSEGIERMRISSDGDVGINKTTPTATFHVDGTIKLENLPTSDPAVANQLWNDNGRVIVSTGTLGDNLDLKLPEVSSGPSLLANNSIIYSIDNGSSQTNLMAQMPSGSAQKILGEPPTLSGSEPGTVYLIGGENFGVDASVWFDGDVTHYAADLPRGVAINSLTGLISGAITYTPSETFTVRAYNGIGYLDYSFSFEVIKTLVQMQTQAKAWFDMEPTTLKTDLVASFDSASSQYLSMGANAEALDGEFTISIWTKPNSSTPSGSALVSLIGAGTGYLRISFDGPVGRLRFILRGNGFAGGTITYHQLTLDSWAHVCVIRDASDNVTVYVNGSSIASQVHPGAVWGVSTEIGRSNPIYHYDGEMAHLAIWDSDQSANIATLATMQMLPTSLETTAALYCPLWEPRGTYYSRVNGYALTNVNYVVGAHGPVEYLAGDYAGVSNWINQGLAGTPFSDLTPPTAGDAPQLMPDGVFWDGTAKGLVASGSMSQPNTIVIWYERTSLSGFGFVMDGVSGSLRQTLFLDSGVEKLWAGVDNVGAQSGSLSPRLAICELNGASSSLEIDGVQQFGNAGNYNLSGIILGARYTQASTMVGYISRVMCFDRLLSSAEKAALRAM